ncbi:MAG: biotin--[Clostridia bacterium]|nr:biotin--[acetyl-CoA-carboxylase] ligase [Clostridia bacterium]
MVSVQRLCEQLGTAQCAPELYVFDEIDSTNNEARRMAVDGFCGTALIAAAAQSAGRGRMGRSFYSPAQTGAYFSILYTPQTPLFDAVRITSAAAVATMRAIRALTGKQTQIKWVNDLYLDGKKVCGILAEAVSVGSTSHVIVGIGVNLCTEDFPDAIASVAGALGTRRLSPEDLIARVYCELERYLRDPDDRTWLADYRAYSLVIGKDITWTDAGVTHAGRALAIDDNGALLVRGEDGTSHRLWTGEISVRLQ